MFPSHEELDLKVLARVTERGPPRWCHARRKPDRALVLEGLNVAVLLVESNPETGAMRDRNQVLLLARLSLIRLHMLLKDTGVEEPAAYSFSLPVILINGTEVEILGCQLRGR